MGMFGSLAKMSKETVAVIRRWEEASSLSTSIQPQQSARIKHLSQLHLCEYTDSVDDVIVLEVKQSVDRGDFEEPSVW